MTLPLYYDPEAIDAHRHAGSASVDADDLVTLSPSVAHHAMTVRRHQEGDEIELSDGRGLRARGRLTASGTARIVSALQEPEPRPMLVLAQALAKGDRDLQAVEAATEVGVDAVIPFEAQRSIVRWPAAKRQKAAEKWRARARAAGMQSRRARMPELEELSTAKDIAARADAGALVLVLHEAATEPLAALTPSELRQAAEIIVVVGPEGGLHPDELAAFGEGRIVRLGPTVLRSSTAGPIACALLQDRLGRWS